VIDPHTGELTLTGPGTTIDIGGVGPLGAPSAITPAQILAEFGQPPSSSVELIPPVRRTSGGEITELNYTGIQQVSKNRSFNLRYASGTGISFGFYDTTANNLGSIWVSSPAYQTPQGIRVGSTQVQVQAAYPGINCTSAPGNCYLTTYTAAGQPVGIDFLLDLNGGATVSVIAVGDIFTFH
jgi:hypothetical protein